MSKRMKLRVARPDIIHQKQVEFSDLPVYDTLCWTSGAEKVCALLQANWELAVIFTSAPMVDCLVARMAEESTVKGKNSMERIQRPRRLRGCEAIGMMVRGTRLFPESLILPLFWVEGADILIVKAAAKARLIDEHHVMCESAVAVSWAGANLLMIYYALKLAKAMQKGEIG